MGFCIRAKSAKAVLGLALRQSEDARLCGVAALLRQRRADELPQLYAFGVLAQSQGPIRQTMADVPRGTSWVIDPHTFAGLTTTTSVRKVACRKGRGIVWKDGPPSFDGSHLDWADEGAWGASARPARVSLIDRSDDGFVEKKFSRRMAGK